MPRSVTGASWDSFQQYWSKTYLSPWRVCEAAAWEHSRARLALRRSAKRSTGKPYCAGERGRWQVNLAELSWLDELVVFLLAQPEVQPDLFRNNQVLYQVPYRVLYQVLYRVLYRVLTMAWMIKKLHRPLQECFEVRGERSCWTLNCKKDNRHECKAHVHVFPSFFGIWYSTRTWEKLHTVNPSCMETQQNLIQDLIQNLIQLGCSMP